MDRNVAVKRLSKMLGKQFGYQIDRDAPSPEEREAAKSVQKEFNDRYEKAAAAAKARREFLLEQDAEYQAAIKELNESRVARDKNFSIQHRHKISVGTSNSMFFHVKASGDSWEQIFEKLKTNGTV